MGNGVSAPDTEPEELAAARLRHEAASTWRKEVEAARIRALMEEDISIMQQEHALITQQPEHVARMEAPRCSIGLSAAAVAIVAALAVDWVVHGYMPFIKWRMKRRLLGGHMLRLAAPERERVLACPALPAPTSFLPVLLYGPTGCGKSFAMAQLARQLHAAHVPVAMVRFRLPRDTLYTRRGKKTHRSASAATGTILMHSVAASVCDQVGYPARAPLLSSLARSIATSAGDVQGFDHSSAQQAHYRTVAALSALFDVARDVCMAQRRYTVSTAPVLMFDDMYDLIRNNSFKQVGGLHIFAFLGTRFVMNGTDGNVRIIAAGSSSEFARQLGDSSPLISTRRCMVQMQDPSPQVLAVALQRNGYTLQDVNSMLSLCGPRLRLLDQPLSTGPEQCPATQFVCDMTRHTLAELRELFAIASDVDASKLGRLLDSILDADEYYGHVRPSVDFMSEEFLKLPPSKILYWDSSELFHFQSALVRSVWKAHRAELMTTYASFIAPK